MRLQLRLTPRMRAFPARPTSLALRARRPGPSTDARERRASSARGWLVIAAFFTLILGLVSAPSASADVDLADTGERSGQVDRGVVLERWLSDTWRSVEAMVVDSTGLPADKIGAGLTPGERARYTSPTNIATYLWSVVVARDTGLITPGDARDRVSAVLGSLAAMDVHEPSGMFFNWYDPNTGDVITTWPEDGSTVLPFLSSVDNGWLASGLMVARTAFPALADESQALLDAMDFRWFYDPEGRSPDFPTGFVRGGFWETEPADCSVKGNYTGSDDPDVYYNCVHYGGLNNDPRIAYYAAIALGDLSARVYYGLYRTFPNGPCADWGWTEQKATGPTRTYLGVPTFEGSYTYRGLRFVPSYGGSMFEALMADLVVPEDEWGPRSWGRTHPAFVQGQIEHGLIEAKYGYWGFSPANNPFGGYGVYGVDAMGEAADGWTSDAEGTLVDRGWPGCRDPQPAPTEWGDGIVTPHASFLALRYAPLTAIANLLRIEHRLGAYGPGGFFDSVAVRSGTTSRAHLMLDQGMVMAALGNVLADDTVRRHFAGAGVRQVLRPLLARETFNVPAHQRRSP
jgi:Putative glucoamylase